MAQITVSASRLGIWSRFGRGFVATGEPMAAFGGGRMLVFPQHNHRMEWLINTVFSMILATDVRSPDPAIAAFKRARLLTIVCALGAVVFLVLASSTQPDEMPVSLAHVVHDVAWRLYAGGAVFCMLVSAWNALLWWRAAVRLEGSL